MHRPTPQMSGQFGPPTIPPAAAVRPAGHLPLQLLQRPLHSIPQGGPPNIRPLVQHEVAATQQQVLMLQVGAVATIFGSNHESTLSYEDYHRRQLENAGILATIEDCRYREEAMLNLEEAVTQSSLPRLFGLNDVDRSLAVKLFPPKRNPRADAIEEQDRDKTLDRHPYSSILPYKGSDEINQPLLNQELQKLREPNISLAECLENLILTCKSPILSLADTKGRQLRCLREAPPGGFVVTPSAVMVLGEVAQKILQDLITVKLGMLVAKTIWNNVQRCVEVRSENPIDDEIDENSLREAMRRFSGMSRTGF